MRKEILFAILAGVTFGLIIAFGVWRANVALKPESVKTSAPEDSSEAAQADFGITIAKPQDYQVITSSQTVLSGVTKPGAWVSVSAEDEDYIINADEDGAFEVEVDTAGGVNEIVITAFDEDGAQVEERLVFVYSTEFAKQIGEDEEEEESATEEADSVRDKVQQKVEEARSVPFAYIGTVTDISEQTLQINKFVFTRTENDTSEIQQISIDDEETAFVKITKVSKVVEFSDVAIGDFIITMGFKNGNGVLSAKRVLITTPIEPTKRKAVYGEVDEIGKKEITLTASDGREWTAEFGKSWKGPELDEIDKGNVIIAVGTASEATLETRTLFVIPAESPSPSPTPTPSPEPEE
ncbi:MAG: Ig-like domain-containing protein [Microgenomates group bacterium]